MCSKMIRLKRLAKNCFKMKMIVNIAIVQLLFGYFGGNASKSSEMFGPKFVSLPSTKIRFSNSSGTELHCRAAGNPEPIIEWFYGPDENSMQPVQNLPDLLTLMDKNTTLKLHKFPSHKYLSKLHSNYYQCLATNIIGTTASPVIDVRAVVDQVYDLQVFPSYAYLSNTGILRCLMPPFVKEYLIVTSWMWGSKVINTDIQTGGRYSVFPHGDLHIRNVTQNDAKEPFRCLARHKLTGEKTLSSVAGRLTVQNLEQAGTVPAKVIDLGYNELFAEQGSSIEIPCIAIGLPSPKYSWFKRQTSTGVDRSVFPETDRDLRFIGGSIFVPRVDKVYHEGLWTCHAKNDLGYDNKTIKLTVTAPISVKIDPDRLRVNVGDEITVACLTEGFPIRRIRWMQNGKFILTELNVSRSRDKRSVLAGAAPDSSRRKRGLLTLLVHKQQTDAFKDTEKQTELEDFNRVEWDGKNLMIRDVHREDRGIYQCVVDGLHDEVAMQTFQLDLGDSRPYIQFLFNHQLVHEGQPLVVECVAAGTPQPTIQWSLDGKSLSSSSLVDIHTRADVDGDSVTSTLTLPRVQLQQSGVYSCKASNSKGWSVRSERIDVHGEPFVRSMDPINVITETSVLIQCPYGGYPIEKIVWSKDGEDLPVNERQLVYKNGSLLLRGISRDDAGSYRCSLTSSKQLKASSDVIITVMVAPQIEPFYFASGLQEGGRTRVSCTAHLGDLPIKFEWYFGQEELIGDELNRMNGVFISVVDPFTSSLSFPLLKTEHSGNYTCVARNDAAKDSKSAILIVNVPPKWIIPPSDVEVMVGDSVSLDCLVSGTPTPSIRWSIADEKEPGKFHEVQTIISDYRIMGNGSLVIEKSQAMHQGHYLCKADNGVVHGSSLSKIAHIKINVPANFLEPFSHQNVSVGEKAVIECAVEGDNPIKVSWMRNEKLLQTDDAILKVKEETTQSGMTSRLILRKVRRQDSATFHCFAENKFGKSQRTVALVVQEPPEIPDNFQLVSFSSRTANLTWKIPYDGNSPIIEFQIHYKKIQETWSLMQKYSARGDNSWTELHTLSPASQYNIRVVAINAVGISHPSRVIEVTTKEEVPEGPPLDVEAIANTSQSLVITWKPPHPERQNGRILGYYLGYKVTNSTEPYRYLSLEDTNQRLELAVDHLKKYTQYSIVVQAFNRIGAGPRSQEISASTAEDVPSSPPRHVQCTPLTSTSLLIIWSPPPVSDMNGILTDYRVFYRPLKEWTDTVEILEQTTLQHKISLFGLEKYQNYSVQVVASTKVGQGLKSRSIYCRTKEDLPGPPASVKAVSLDQGSVLVSWLEPSQPNGHITSYRVHMKTMENGRQYIQHYDLFQPEETYYSIRGLNQNQPYSFWVTASTVQGEGIESEIVNETPQTPVPATVASFSRMVIHAIKEDAVLKCLALGQPKPIVEWRINGKSLDQTDRIRTEAGGSVVRINRLSTRDTANYTCSAQNHFGFDSITYQLIVKLSRNNGVPPAPPTLSVVDTTGSSISLGWTPAADGGAPLIAYHVHYHREFGDWDRLDVSARETSYTLTGLRCGTNYQFYLQALNDFGVGERTESISARTRGSSPLAPALSKDFLKVNSTSINLNLAKWRNGGCPISSFVIEYRVKPSPSPITNSEEDSQTWILVNNNVKPILQVSSDVSKEFHVPYFFSVLDLMPETRYTLRMTAHNSAGSTVQEYDFTTLTFSGATIAPELIIHSEYGGSILSNPSVMVPVSSCFLVIIVIGLVFLWFWQRRKISINIGKGDGGVSEAELLQACSSVNADLGRSNLIPNSHGLLEGSKALRGGLTEDRYSGYNTLDSHCLNLRQIRPNISDSRLQQQFIMGTLSIKKPVTTGRYQVDFNGFQNYPGANVYDGEPMAIIPATSIQQHINATPVRFYSPCYADPSSTTPVSIDGYATIKSEEESSGRDESDAKREDRGGRQSPVEDAQQWIPLRQLYKAHRL